MVAATLALSAAVTALYLGSFQVGWLSAVWDPLFGMGSAYVLESYLSRTFESFVGVPDAIVGAAAYGVETLLLLSGGHRRAWTQPWLTVACGALTGILALTGLGLVLVQASIHHWCFLCLVTAGISWCLAALTWNELMTPDPRAVADFYEAVFGWKANHAPMEGMEYTVFMVDGGSENGIAGAMKPPMEGMPAFWGVYFNVDDAEATVKRAKELGASVMMEASLTPGVGTLAAMADPQGAMFSIMTPEA